MKTALPIFLFSAISFLTVECYPQSNSVDSLKNIPKTNNGDNTELTALLSLGESYVNDNHLDSASVAFQRALIIASATHDKRNEAIALLMLGSITAYLGDYGQALTKLFRATQIFEQIGDQDGRIEVHMILQGIYREAGDFSSALKHAFIVKNQLKKNDTKGVFIFRDMRILPLVLAEIGETYQHMDQLDSAEFYAKGSVDERLLYNGATWNFPIYLLGKIQTKQGRYDQALSNYKMAIPLAIKNRVLKDTLDIYNSIAELYRDTGDLDSAIFYCKSIIEKRVLNVNILLRAQSTLAHVYRLKNNTDSAFKYLDLSSALKDSIYSTERQKQFQSAIFNEQLRQKESEEQREEQRRQIVMYVLIAGLIAFLIIALLLYRNNLQKQSAKVKIEKAFDELKATQKQLIQSEKMASLGELTAGIAHEIQNPLNFVNNFSELNAELIDELKKELAAGNVRSAEKLVNDVEENEGKINHHGRRADSIVKSMLQHSRTSNDQKTVADINALCEEYIRLAYHGYRAKDSAFNATFETKLDTDLPKVNVVAQNIGRVILNLINNASYAVHEKSKLLNSDYTPTVKISTKNLGSGIEIRVQDNGHGMPESIKEKIFQPFFTTKPTGQGTGLGLSLSYDIVKAHGGELQVETKEGKGSEFIIKLPVVI